MDLLLSLLTGGATGLLGTAISGALEYIKQRQANQHELAKAEADRKTLEMEISGRERVAAIDAEQARDLADASAFGQSITADVRSYAGSDATSGWLVLVDVIRGLTRPTLTATLVVFAVIIWFTSDDQAIQASTANTVLYLATAAVLWWFGTRVRPPAKS